jgi:hypothetical protein
MGHRMERMGRGQGVEEGQKISSVIAESAKNNR